jgi:hypothetical protein
MRGELLKVVCQIVDCTPSNLPNRIRKLVADHSQVEDSKKLRDENAALNLELGTLIQGCHTGRPKAFWRANRAGGRAALSIMPYMNQAGYLRQRNYCSKFTLL